MTATLNDILNGKANLTAASDFGLPDGVLTSYGWRAFTEEVETVAETTEPGRNHQLNVSAMKLFQLVETGDLERDTVYDALYVAAMDCGLEVAETRGTLRSAERGAQRHPRPDREQVAVALHVVPPETDAAEPVTRERSTWWPQDIAAHVRGEAPPEPPPSFFQRRDGACLFYAGRVNGLIGASESGKSWCALTTVLQTLASGRRACYVDFEDTASSVVERLLLMGASQESMLERFTYVGPESSLDLVASADLSEHLAAFTPELVILDGVNAAMTLMGLDLLDNKDATTFHQKLMRPIAGTGACVVFVDHVTKSKDNRDGYAIGAQAKKAMVSGCALTVDVTRPFGVGQHGEMRLTVSKDRRGEVRGISHLAGQSHVAGVFNLDSRFDTTRAWIEPPSTLPWLPTGIMEKCSRALEALSPQTAGQLKESVGCKDDHRRDALQRLIAAGHVRIENGPGNSFVHHHVSPYVEPSGTDFDEGVASVSNGE